jgi:MFS family permease
MMSAAPVADTPRSHHWFSREGLVAHVQGKGLSREFWRFFTAAFFYDFGFSMFFFLFNLFLLDFGFNEKSLGFITSAMTIGSVVGTIPVGLLSRKFGPQRLLRACFLLAPLFSALRTVMVWQSAQIGLAFFTGICLCMYTVCFSPAVAQVTTEANRPFAFSLVFSVGIATGALGGVVGGYLPQWLEYLHPAIHITDAKRWVLLISCGIALMGVFPAWRLRAQPEEAAPTSSSLHFNPFLLRFLAAMAVWSIVLGSFTPFANVYLSRHLSIPLSHIGIIFSISQLVQVAAVLIAPMLLRRWGVVKGIMLMQLATAVALGCLAGERNSSIAVITYLGFTAALWMSGPGIYSLLMNRMPKEQHSTASALNICVMSVFQAGAAAAAGTLFLKFGYPTVLLFIGGVAIAAALLFKGLLGSDVEDHSQVTTQ